MAAADFLGNLIAAVPYKIQIVLTENGIQLTHQERRIPTLERIVDRVFRDHEIAHGLSKIKHPWTNGQFERMNRMIKGEPSNVSTTATTARYEITWPRAIGL
jgi:hypothetical protein